MNPAEAILRLELLKTNPDVLSKFEEARRKEQEAYFRTMVGVGGSVKRISGDVVVLTPGRFVDMSQPAGGRLLKGEQLPKPVRPKVAPTTPHVTDYSNLLIDESRRRTFWSASAKWKENWAALLRWTQTDRRDQVVLTATEMAAEELQIPRPAVRAWRGDEAEARGVVGWVFVKDPDEINVTLNRTCQQIARTAAHECRHIWQHAHYPNLTHEQREKDAEYYANYFGERVFEKKAA